MSGFDSDSVRLLLETVAAQAQTIKAQAETIRSLMGEPAQEELDSPAPTRYMDGTQVR